MDRLTREAVKARGRPRADLCLQGKSKGSLAFVDVLKQMKSLEELLASGGRIGGGRRDKENDFPPLHRCLQHDFDPYTDLQT